MDSGVLAGRGGGDLGFSLEMGLEAMQQAAWYSNALAAFVC